MELPKVLRDMMSTLVADNPLLSWNIYQEKNGQIVVKLRFRGGHDQPTVAQGPLCYRKKPPSQAKRDARRLAEHKLRSPVTGAPTACLQTEETSTKPCESGDQMQSADCVGVRTRSQHKADTSVCELFRSGDVCAPDYVQDMDTSSTFLDGGNSPGHSLLEQSPEVHVAPVVLSPSASPFVPWSTVSSDLQFEDSPDHIMDQCDPVSDQDIAQSTQHSVGSSGERDLGSDVCDSDLASGVNAGDTVRYGCFWTDSKLCVECAVLSVKHKSSYGRYKCHLHDGCEHSVDAT